MARTRMQVRSTQKFVSMTNGEIAAALNKVTGSTLTEGDVTDWIGDDSGTAGENYDKNGCRRA